MPVFFLVDTSGSMDGKNIGAVNSAIEEIIPDLRHLSESQADSEIRLAVMQFSSGCEWVTPSLMTLDSFDDWVPLRAGGLTELGAALDELNKKLSKNGFLDRRSASSGFYAPVIILLTDGEPTDDYVNPLKKLQVNKWYQSALKIAIAVGDANKEVLKRVVRNIELVINVDDISQLKKVIRFIAVTSSQIASTSATVSEDIKPSDVKDVRPVQAEKQMVKALETMFEEDNSAHISRNTHTDNTINTANISIHNASSANQSDDDDDWD
jgi:uncharacterized protein YegL